VIGLCGGVVCCVLCDRGVCWLCGGVVETVVCGGSVALVMCGWWVVWMEMIVG
jgi:hypothetical protein